MSVAFKILRLGTRPLSQLTTRCALPNSDRVSTQSGRACPTIDFAAPVVCGVHEPGCRFIQVLKTPALMVGDFACPGTPPVTDVEAAPYPEVVLARSGAYVRRDSAGAVYIDRTVAAFFEARRPYVIEHPRPRPDLTTVISIVDPEALCDSLGIRARAGQCFARSAIRATADLHLLHRQLLAAVRAQSQPALDAEERAIALVQCAVGSNHGLRSELAMPATRPLSRREVDVVVAIAEYLNSNYCRRIGLAAIAAYSGYSVFHVCRLFQARMKTTIHKYLTALRLEAAMQRLAETDMSIIELAMELGFSSHSHFTAAFSRWAGVSPSRARLRARRGARGLSESS